MMKGGLQLVTDVPSGELALLLAQSDILHTGDASLKAEGFRLLLDNRAEYGDSREFLWRLARAYSDMYKSTEDKQEKKTYAQQGWEEAEAALRKNGLNAECHKWFAVLTGLSTQHESMHSKLKSSHILKEHLDRAVALRDNDPMCFYLLGRWCYEVATLDWLEKKAAAALYQSPPTSTLHDALENFLKAEELSPGFSKTVRLYIAQCHRELGNISEATNWTELALKTPTNSNDDEETSKLEAQLQVLTHRKI
ncbi:Regulator of microtubule dynamics protein 3 [Larimichthys crocea]|uniref:Regulator of microtubule dynamics protein 3 n=1 Tax=Larimichthys crocea TaxID=215358 RepID=A0A6G0I6T5_LARCR|nr:Regulator of microtubule dynamics protein 3 [Larimichthys crocea]